MKAVKKWSAVAVAGLSVLTLSPAGSATGETTTAPVTVADAKTTDVLADIPIGPADEDVRTSAGITRILINCADAYESVKGLHAQGTERAVEVARDPGTGPP